MTSYLHRRSCLGIVSAALVGALTLGILGFAPADAAAQTITIKMATLVPENSSWYLVLKDVADKWGKISGGKVKVILLSLIHI